MDNPECKYLPIEIKEKILRCVQNRWHYILISVCKDFYFIIHRLRRLQNKSKKIKTWPIDMVISIPMIKWARNNGCPFYHRMCGYCSINGRFEVLKWLYKNGCPWDDKTCAWAAYRGNMEMLEWVYNKGCSLNKLTFYYAAVENHFNILKWLHEKKCPSDNTASLGAAGTGHLEVLQWLYSNGYCYDLEEIFEVAEERGQLHIIQYIEGIGIPH